MTDTMHAGEMLGDDGYEERRDALVNRLVGSFVAGTELFTVELGRRLGLYRLLFENGAMTVARFASVAGANERYAREWLEQQAAAGIIAVVDGEGADGRRYALPDAHVPVLVVETDPYYAVGFAALLAGAAVPFNEVVEAFTTGNGVAYEKFGPDLRWGIAAMNRPGFEHDLRRWVEAIPDVSARLEGGGAILDLGCGVGWSTIALAEAYPASLVHGVDMDADSIAEAKVHVEEHGVADRVTFTLGNATRKIEAPSGGFALVCIFEALHDMGDPVSVLASILPVLAPEAAVLIGDEKVTDEFVAPAEELDRMQYAISVMHCLPATMAESAAVANGTVLRAPTVQRWSADAGFGRFEVLPIEHPFWKFYAIRP